MMFQAPGKQPGTHRPELHLRELTHKPLLMKAFHCIKRN